MFTESELEVFKNCDLNEFKRWFKTLKKARNSDVSILSTYSYTDATTGLEAYVLDKDFVQVVLREPSQRSVNLLYEDLGRLIKVSSK